MKTAITCTSIPFVWKSPPQTSSPGIVAQVVVFCSRKQSMVYRKIVCDFKSHFVLSLVQIGVCGTVISVQKANKDMPHPTAICAAFNIPR